MFFASAFPRQLSKPAVKVVTHFFFKAPQRSTIGVGYGGQEIGTRVVRWVLKGDRVLLESVDYSQVTDPSNLLKDAAKPRHEGPISS